VSSVLARGRGLSIASMAMLHQTLRITRGTLERILVERRNFRDNLQMVKTMYVGVEDVPSEEQKTKADAPVEEAPGGDVTDEVDESTKKGIGIEMKCVLLCSVSGPKMTFGL
jgi:hypothetical protein